MNLLPFLFFTKIVLAAQATTKSTQSIQNTDLDQQWLQFKLAYNKTYQSDQDEKIRKQLFFESKRRVDEHNKRFLDGKVKFTRTINEYSDYSRESVLGMFRKIMPDKLKTLERKLMKVDRSTDFNLTAKGDLPSSVDWREKNVVTPVRNQGPIPGCGSCYAFGVLAVIEAHYALKFNTSVVLSPQQVVNCSMQYGNTECYGGFVNAVFEYALDNGLALDQLYPYTSIDPPYFVDTECRYNQNDSLVKITGYMNVPGDEETMRLAVSQFGPVVSALQADDLVDYKSGIYHLDSCDNMNHIVAIVGYGVENGTKYWIVKNSWGPNWGENGYFRIERGKDMCGIEAFANYPLFD